jgi:hypothetical protein
MSQGVSIEWDRKLWRRRGATRRLGGLEVYYDFTWRSVFLHNRAVFPRGQSLSDLVRRDCPEGKRPTLLLTERTDIAASIKETDERYIVIVPIHEYLRSAGADAASTYYARLCGTRLTQLASLSEINFSSAEFNSFLDKHLSRDALARWAAGAPERKGVLIDIAGELEALPEDVVGFIRRLSVADVRIFDELVNYLDRFEGAAGVRALLKRLTESALGRSVAAHALAERLSERIADTRGQLNVYRTLIASSTANESQVQELLELNPWIVGLPYVGARARVEIPRGEIDFVLDRYDGFFDIVELKGPGDLIVIERGEAGAERPPSASSYSLGSALGKALAQAHHYRSILDQSRDLHLQYGLADSRQPKILILLGRSTDLSEPSREILRQLNLSLHRVEVVPYDLLGRRTEGLLNNIESLLAGPSAP